jgi:hypothetical protein
MLVGSHSLKSLLVYTNFTIDQKSNKPISDIQYAIRTIKKMMPIIISSAYTMAHNGRGNDACSIWSMEEISLIPTYASRLAGFPTVTDHVSRS